MQCGLGHNFSISMYVNKRFQVRIPITGFCWMSKGSANNASYSACVRMLQMNSSFHVFIYEPQKFRGSYQYLLFSVRNLLYAFALPSAFQCVVRPLILPSPAVLFASWSAVCGAPLSKPEWPPPFPSSFSPIAPMELGKILKLWQSGLVTCICLELVCYLALIRWQSNNVINYSNWLLREDRDSKSWCLWSPDTCNDLRKEWHLLL